MVTIAKHQQIETSINIVMKSQIRFQILNRRRKYKLNQGIKQSQVKYIFIWKNTVTRSVITETI